MYFHVKQYTKGVCLFSMCVLGIVFISIRSLCRHAKLACVCACVCVCVSVSEYSTRLCACVCVSV